MQGSVWSFDYRIEVYDWDRDGGHDFIGDCNTTMEELAQGEDFQILQVQSKQWHGVIFLF